MKTTIESSHPYVKEIANMSPGARQYIYSLGDEVERLKPDDAHARKSRTDRLEALIEAAINNIRASLEAVHYRFRTTKVLDHLKAKRNILYSFDNPPSRPVIKRVLAKHGLYE